MWGERGLVATFFADLWRLSDLAVANEFLVRAGFPESMTKHLGDIQEFSCVIEPDFGNQGFGHPDAIIKVKYRDTAAVIIVEAKRTTYQKACKPASFRGQPGYNSTLNGQLELDFCLAMALSKYGEGNPKLEEPKWVLTTGYNEDRRGRLRCVKNANVLRDLAMPFGGCDFKQYYYLIITTDDRNPIDTAGGSDTHPMLYVPQGTGIDTRICDYWKDYRSQFGWINYRSMEAFVDAFKGRLPLGSLFIPTYEMNKKNFGEGSDPCGEFDDSPEPGGDDDTGGGMGIGIGPQGTQPRPPLKGSWIVKRKKDGAYCHLSFQGSSCALRRFDNDGWTELDRAKDDPGKLRRIVDSVEYVKKAPRKPLDNIGFWRDYFQQLRRR